MAAWQLPSFSSSLCTMHARRDSHPYQRVDTATIPTISDLKFQPMLPLESPLPSSPRPPTQDKPRPSWLPDAWMHSVHVLPAAFPRSYNASKAPKRPMFTPSQTTAERNRQLAEAHRRLVDLRMNESAPVRTDKALWVTMDRYVRTQNDGNGLTLFFAHANGLNRETWNPTIARILASPVEVYISEIWVWDAVNHGDSYVLNEGNTEGMFHWHEGVRDLLNFFIYYLPCKPGTACNTQAIPKVHSSISAQRLQTGLPFRKIVMVGHSFGGTLSTLAALEYPHLFASLILIDPIIVYPVTNQPVEHHFEGLTLGALRRKDTWKNRSEARTQMLSLPFFQRWHPEVFNTYIDHALRDIDDTRVTLKTPALQEAVVFADTWTGCEEAWVRLYRGELPEKVSLHWIVPGRGQAEVAGPGKTRPRVWLRRKNASNVMIEGVGHLIVQEKPQELAEEIGVYIMNQFGRVKANM